MNMLTNKLAPELPSNSTSDSNMKSAMNKQHPILLFVILALLATAPLHQGTIATALRKATGANTQALSRSGQG